MTRKRIITGILAAGLTLSAVLGIPEYSRIAVSARNFQHNFRAMQNTGGSLGPVERFVYSLVLANSTSTPTEKPRS